jgi:hypothetical protein
MGCARSQRCRGRTAQRLGVSSATGPKAFPSHFAPSPNLAQRHRRLARLAIPSSVAVPPGLVFKGVSRESRLWHVQRAMPISNTNHQPCTHPSVEEPSRPMSIHDESSRDERRSAAVLAPAGASPFACSVSEETVESVVDEWARLSPDLAATRQRRRSQNGTNERTTL